MADAIYARQSIAKQDSVSIESQIEKCKAICNLNGRDFVIYKDEGYSGKDLNRPSFNQMMTDIKDGKIDHIVCYRLDRISRSIADFSQLIINLEQYGVDFVSATENFDTSSPLGRAMVNIIMTFAQLERETITERVTDNYYYRSNQGYWPGGISPYGYKLGKATDQSGKRQSILEIDESEAAVVRLIFDLYLQHHSIRRVALILSENDYRTRRGTLWASTALFDLIRSPLYTSNTAKIYSYFEGLGATISNDIDDFDGKRSVNCFGKSSKQASASKRSRDPKDMFVVVSNHIPILDDDTWLMAQQIRAATKSKPFRSGTSKNSYLTGLIKCAHCGRSMTIVKDAKKYRGYYCPIHKNSGYHGCPVKVITANKLEKAVLDNMLDHFHDPLVIEAIENYKPSDQTLSNDQQEHINKIDLELIKINNELEALMLRLADTNDIVVSYVNKRITELHARKVLLTEELKTIESDSFQNNLFNIDSIRDFALNIDRILENQEFDEMKDLCHTVIKCITADNDGIEIEYFI